MESDILRGTDPVRVDDAEPPEPRRVDDAEQGEEEEDLKAAAAEGKKAAAPAPPQQQQQLQPRNRTRTFDIQSSSRSFEDLMVPPALVSALAAAGFHQPSPVQQQSIPLGRLGTDLIVQAKSGTGKTVVFSLICLERIKMEVPSPQALILAPTREIAIQSEQVLSKLIQGLPDGGAPKPVCASFVGGLNIVGDEKKLRRLVHIVVGTPGRICSLLQSTALVASKISMFVLDEADSLLSEAFYSDVTWVYDQLPKRKQVMAFSATYTPEMLADLEPLMKRPQRIMLCSETVSLEGVRQFYVLVGGEGGEKGRGQLASGGGEAGHGKGEEDGVFLEKVEHLLRLLSSLAFHQAVVFCNRKPRAEWLATRLTAAGFPSAYLSGDRPQEERMEAMEAVRGFRLRVIVSTDVMARGVDLDRVNVVANLDLPYDSATYVHRVGRTGRFGSLGISVSYVTQEELKALQGYLEEAQAGTVLPLPESIPADMYSFDLGNDWEKAALEELKQAPKAEDGKEGHPVVPPLPLASNDKKKKKTDKGEEEAKSREVSDGQSQQQQGETQAGRGVGGATEGWQYDPYLGWQWGAPAATDGRQAQVATATAAATASASYPPWSHTPYPHTSYQPYTSDYSLYPYPPHHAPPPAHPYSHYYHPAHHRHDIPHPYPYQDPYIPHPPSSFSYYAQGLSPGGWEGAWGYPKGAPGTGDCTQTTHYYWGGEGAAASASTWGESGRNGAGQAKQDLSARYQQAYEEYMNSQQAVTERQEEKTGEHKGVGEDDDEGEDAASHLRMDMLQGAPAEADGGKEEEGEEEEEEAEAEAGEEEEDLPRSEDLEDHAVNVIESLTLLEDVDLSPPREADKGSTKPGGAEEGEEEDGVSEEARLKAWADYYRSHPQESEEGVPEGVSEEERLKAWSDYYASLGPQGVGRGPGEEGGAGAWGGYDPPHHRHHHHQPYHHHHPQRGHPPPHQPPHHWPHHHHYHHPSPHHPPPHGQDYPPPHPFPHHHHHHHHHGLSPPPPPYHSFGPNPYPYPWGGGRGSGGLCPECQSAWSSYLGQHQEWEGRWAAWCRDMDKWQREAAV